MGEAVGETAGDDGAVHLDGVDEGERVGDFFKCAADEGKVKPDAREPRGEVGEEGAADAADLLIVKDAAREEPDADIEERNGDDKYY